MKAHTSTERIFQIIEILSNCQSASIEDISQESQIPYTTVYRILQTCIRLGYIHHHKENTFKLTQKLFLLTSSYFHKHHSLTEIAHPYLQKLSYTFKETLHLGIIEDDSVLYIDKIETKYKIRMHSYIGYQAEIYSTALGKVIVAYLSKEEQDNIIEKIMFNVHTPFTINNKKKLQTELALIHTQGYAEDNEEHEIHLYCIAVPIFDRYNQVIAALSTSTLLFRFDKKDKMKTIKLLLNTAEEISKQLGNENYHKHLKN